jgi:hypothetical protein
VSIQVAWGDPELTILHYFIADPWTWEEFYQAMENARQMREARGPEAVHIIFDMSQGHKLPQGALSHFGNLFRRGAASNASVQSIVVASSSSFTKAIYNLLVQVYPGAAKKLFYVSTIEEAYAMLGKQEFNE